MCRRLFNGLLIELIVNLKFLSNGTLHKPTVENTKIDKKRANAENVSFSPNLFIDLKVQCVIGQF